MGFVYPVQITMRIAVYSFRVCVSMALCALAGCAVSSTSQYYLPTVGETFPPKPQDFVVPILEKPPAQPHRVIGQLQFTTDRGWSFVRDSIEYNARRNGADAVILKTMDAREESGWARTPPRTTWVPVAGPPVRCENGRYYYPTRWVPVTSPGVLVPATWEVIGFVAEMIVFR
jgi:hypothetical protein